MSPEHIKRLKETYDIVYEADPKYRGYLGLLRAMRDGLITDQEYRDIYSLARSRYSPGHNDWVRAVVFQCPSNVRRSSCTSSPYLP